MKGRFKRQVLVRFWWLVHPVSVFVMSQLLWTAILTIWIVWFVGRRREIERLTSQLSPSMLSTPSILHTDETSVLILIIVGIVMLSLLGAGTILLFTWGQRQASLIQQQRHFVSSVTHELRTPLASLHLAFETMCERTLPESTKKQLLTMSLVDIERLIRLVNQILISSRLDRGLSMFKDDIKSLHVATMISEITKSFIHLDVKINTRVAVNCSDGLYWRGSHNAFNIVVSNLLENAIKYSPSQKPIVITVSQVKKELKVAVKDFGLGLTPRDRKRIFKMFFRSAIATKSAIPGTGLGLFIVKTTLEQLGGHVDVVSTGPNEGATFTASFPV